MGNFWPKLWVWIKVIIVSALVLYGLTFVLKNSGQSVSVWFWFWKTPYQTALLWLVFLTFVAGVIATILVRTTFATVRQIRELRNRNRTEKLEREVADMRSKAARLQVKSSPGGASSVPASPDDSAE